MIGYQVKDGVAEILLNNPPVNAITVAFLDALMAALRRADADPDVRAVTIASALPGRFSAGLDVPTFLRGTPEQAHTVVNMLYVQLHELQASLGKPTIAAVTGAVRGGGISIAITCDMIVAADDATFGYPEMEVGLLPAIHYTHLPRIVGRYRAFDLLFTGRTFDAREALELGLVSRLAPQSQVAAEAHGVARVLAAKSPTLMRMGKRGFTRAIDNGYRQGAGSAVDLITVVSTTRDGREGMQAFAEKRKPVWSAD
ncbi:enoyl-CoA hydratase/isomerase family protein [Reyranella sp. CPCC 100927]|uniref:enoyl-CoA hydratase/isomerase family protein n=1 Tax=Reyranella sp. CPCC 100927 TaxID=2599616 RepID=UPI0011B6D0F6|nr:enoyl-CoA hydratase/isomerase family protein [Reyranella sp. CPCC 100927]TWT11488.1 enoyl-CoA hydratase/isomerase family protein [Reyranella sp. CPCC 100927]